MVNIIVAVENGLDEIRQGLTSKGYNIVDMETYNHPIDAIVYRGDPFQVSYVSGNGMPWMRDSQKTNYGVIMINSLGNTVDQIDEMLKMKYYRHLF